MLRVDGDDVEVGFIGSLRVAQIGQLHQRVHVRIFDVALGVGGRIAGLVPDQEIGSGRLHAAELDHIGADRAVESVDERSRSGAGRDRRPASVATESALAMFSEMMRMRPICARKPEAAMVSDFMKSMSWLRPPASGDKTSPLRAHSLTASLIRSRLCV